MVQGLEHLQLIVDHALVALDVLLEDNLDGHLPRATFGLADDTVCARTEGSAEFILRPVARHVLL